LKSSTTNPNYYKVYVLGEWGQNIEGLIYPDYETVAEMPAVQAYGLDFGYNDPVRLVEISTEDKPGVEKKNLYWKELIYESHLTSTLLIERMNTIGVNKNIVIVADSARPEMIVDIRKAGFHIVPCTKYKGSVVEGINAVKKFNLKIVAGGKISFVKSLIIRGKRKMESLRTMSLLTAVNHLMDAGKIWDGEL
jgi:phage terminase large subunit